MKTEVDSFLDENDTWITTNLPSGKIRLLKLSGFTK